MPGSRAADACDEIPPGLDITPQAVEIAPGETLQLEAVGRWYGVRPLQPGCTATWAVTGEGIRIDPSGLLTAGADAMVDSTFQVHVAAAGLRRTKSGLVVDPAPNPLAGAWRQRGSPHCVGPEGPVGELIFRRGSTFLLTIRPFETQVGMVGRYTFDRATGALELWNRDQLWGAGLVSFAGEDLVIKGIARFTGYEPGADCPAVFERRPVPHI